MLTVLGLALTVGLAAGCGNNPESTNQSEVNSGNAAQKEKRRFPFGRAVGMMLNMSKERSRHSMKQIRIISKSK